jgi:hypothetical protein
MAPMSYCGNVAPFDECHANVGMLDIETVMDAEQTIAEIERLERIFGSGRLSYPTS